jgi:hypothetical protein
MFTPAGDRQYHRYYDVHYAYVLTLLKTAGCKIIYTEATDFDNYSKTCFEMKIEDKLVAIDFSDHVKLSVPVDMIKKYTAIFKFHYIPSLHGQYRNIYPFSPVNFQKWDTYLTAVNKIEYKATGLVLCKQRPYGGAVERRNFVLDLLSKRYGEQFDRTIENELNFYMKINQALVSVCVPGARNDMLDRGQSQYFALGCCTISPRLVTILSHNRNIVAGTHYVECKPDYSDLIEKIEWVRENPELAIQIGKNAKELFNETSLPDRQVEWIKICLNNG